MPILRVFVQGFVIYSSFTIPARYLSRSYMKDNLSKKFRVRNCCDIYNKLSSINHKDCKILQSRITV